MQLSTSTRAVRSEPLPTAPAPISSLMPKAATLRVLFVTPLFFPFMGGVENHVYEVARRLAQQNVAVTVLTTDPHKNLSPRETVEQIEIVRVPAYPGDRDYYYAPELYRQITSGSWDVVHVQSYHTLVAPLAMYAAQRAHLPYVVTFHGGGHSSTVRNGARKIQQRLLRPLLARAERLVTLAEFEKTFFQTQLDLPDEKFITIPNGCDLPFIPAHERPATDPNLIVSIGRLERYKGHQRVIAAMPHLLELRPDSYLWIAGTGPFESELRSLAVELGVAERVRISAVPPQDRKRMAHELSRAALVVLLSEYETHPIAILEALSLKRPVLVSETSGLQELVERGYARGVTLTSSPEQIAEGMRQQLEQPFVPDEMQLPTWDECTKNLLELYQSVSRRFECAF